MTLWTRSGRAAAVLALALLAGACGGTLAYRQGKAEAKKGNWDRAVARLTKALDANPDNIEYRIALDRARQEASRVHYEEGMKHVAAEELEQAQDELDIATKFDGANRLAIERLADVRRRIAKREDEQRKRADLDEAKIRAKVMRVPAPVLSPRSTAPITLKFKDTSLQKIFESLGKLAGVNLVMDPDFRDKKVNFDVTGITFEEALNQLTLLHRLFYKVLDQNTLVIAPESPQKRRSYDDLLVQTFYLSNAETKEVTAAVKGLVQGGSFKVVENPTLGAITVTGTADQLALAGRIIHSNDKPRGEVIVEIRIMEISRFKARQYGIALSNYEGAVTFAPFQDPSGGKVDIRAHLLSSINLADFVVTLPSQVFASLSENESAARIVASPRLRASEGKKTSLKVGTEIAIPTTTFTTPQAGGQTSFGNATSFTTRNVGVNMDITPKISAGGEITLEIAAEFSSEGEKREVGGLLIPDILTRNLSGILRLRDGETSLIGGLLQQTELTTAAGPAGLSDVPLLSRIFGRKTKDRRQNEVVISITPRIVRSPILGPEDLAPLRIGTDEVKRVLGAREPLLGLAEPAPAASPGPAAPLARPTPPAAVEPLTSPPGDEQAAPAAPDEAALGAASRPAPVGASGVAQVPSLRAQLAPQALGLKPGEVGALSVILVGAQDLLAVDLVLAYDPAVIEPVDVAPGALLSLDGAQVASEKQADIGRYRARFSRATPTSGAGAVAVFTFRGLKPGNVSLALAELNASTSGGAQRVEVGGTARVTVQP